jgi:hypothetical protein
LSVVEFQEITWLVKPPEPRTSSHSELVNGIYSYIATVISLHFVEYLGAALRHGTITIGQNIFYRWKGDINEKLLLEEK